MSTVCKREVSCLLGSVIVLVALSCSGRVNAQAPDSSAPAAAPAAQDAAPTAAPAEAAAAPAATAAPAAPAADLPSPPATTVEQAYVGTGKCLICHRPQTNTYSETKHAKAFTNMPEKYHGDESCLKCHVTGFGKPDGFVMGTDRDLMMVGCEACHGPGAKHLDAANRFVMAEPGQEAAIEKELHTTIVKTPQDSVCIECHQMQAHHGHPAFEGSKLATEVVSASLPCPPASAVGATPATFPPNSVSRYSVKTCGGCHYDQYKHWRADKHSDLAHSLPAKYAEDQSCKECHAPACDVPASASLAADLQKQWAGLVCEKCHGPALTHVNFNKQFLASVAYSPKLESAARDSIRKGKPTSLCIQCHTTIGHKPHVAYDAK